MLLVFAAFEAALWYVSTLQIVPTPPIADYPTRKLHGDFHLLLCWVTQQVAFVEWQSFALPRFWIPPRTGVMRMFASLKSALGMNRSFLVPSANWCLCSPTSSRFFASWGCGILFEALRIGPPIPSTYWTMSYRSIGR